MTHTVILMEREKAHHQKINQMKEKVSLLLHLVQVKVVKIILLVRVVLAVEVVEVMLKKQKQRVIQVKVKEKERVDHLVVVKKIERVIHLEVELEKRIMNQNLHHLLLQKMNKSIIFLFYCYINNIIYFFIQFELVYFKTKNKIIIKRLYFWNRLIKNTKINMDALPTVLSKVVPKSNNAQVLQY